jgi:signal transduction histidine kinase
MLDHTDNFGTLCILNCHNLEHEVAAAVAAEGWLDVVTANFPSNCGKPPLAWQKLRQLLPPDCTQVMVLGRACLSALGPPPDDFPPTRIIQLEQCFHLLAGQHIVNDAIKNGAYLMTPTWLGAWQIQLHKMGFMPAQADEFFREFATELVLLDTGVDPHATSKLAELGTAVTLPIRRIAVGIDMVRLQLARWVLEWRLHRERLQRKKEKQLHTAELADIVSAMDMLTRMAQMQQEEKVIDSIKQLFQMLFAPTTLYYLRMEHGMAIPVSTIPDDMLELMRGLHQTSQVKDDGEGFLLRIGYDSEVLGVIAVDRVTFPQYLKRYLNLAIAVTGVCGLAIENARNRRKMLELDKMASLGVIVAGVAHEISTPLGVSLTASSALKHQMRELGKRFSEQSMTRSDLVDFLQNAELESELMLSNLARIGQLIAVFRKAYVNEPTLTAKQTFRLKNCFDQVILGLGESAPTGRVEVNIQCDPQLEVEGQPSDWASILANLINNSIIHGFKGLEHGVIDIKVTRESRILQIDYRDDGVGMTPETLARLFDPFYTTDLQHGTGLGMYLVYNLVTQRLGGHIQCESQIGQGVHFRIEVSL